MMRRGRRLLGLVLALIMGMALAGCSAQNAETTAAPTEAAVTWTVTFMNGEEELGTATAADGEILAAADYEAYQSVPDTEFQGWFETPTFLDSSKQDLASLAITEDLTLYGSFRSTNVAEDTRAWYLAGTSEGGPLKDNNWAAESVDEATREQFLLVPTGEAVNEFAITIDLFAGDQFQVIPDWSWDGQKGYGCFTEIDDTQFENGGGLSGDSNTSNVNVIMDGNYTITLTTDPDNSLQDTLTVVRNGDPLTEAETYVASESTGIVMKGSWVEDWSDLRELERAADSEGNVFTITMELPAETEVCFMVYDNGEDTGLLLKEENVQDEASLALMMENGNNIQVAEAGTYTFTVDADAMTVTLVK